MRRLRHFARLSRHSQLLPMLESGDDPLIGGQAVMEGVMMRTPQSYCVAVRKPDGQVVTRERSAKRLSETSRFWALPIVRGCGVLGQSMALGMKAPEFLDRAGYPSGRGRRGVQDGGAAGVDAVAERRDIPGVLHRHVQVPAVACHAATPRMAARAGQSSRLQRRGRDDSAWGFSWPSCSRSQG